ncbi:hypothetical protein ACFSHT_32320 [Paraburkholderia silviterrae]|uniref:Methyl-accepting chemotaxis protein (MCP) signaling protein n=1 Tax=Paraburkholderia silviterrae TaxID=2528715 RepID=A0A4R5M3H8_9BURK|nr:hypothetical protein EYW47_29575 [Paraburkholderia silviterrae]
MGLALAQMDVVTQQNAAFVGESAAAAAAASLAERARSLNMLIAAFKVERATGIGPGGYRT